MAADDPELLDLFRELRRTGRRRIRNELVEAYAPLAAAIGRRFPASGAEADDVQQVALIGLLKAVERFDPDRGVKFSTFADPTIGGEIRRHFRDRTWAMRVGRRNQELGLAARRASEELAQRLGRTPKVKEIAEALDEPVEDVLRAMDARSAYRPDSTDALSDEGSSLGDRLGAVDADLERTADLLVVRELLAELGERDRQVVTLRFEEHLSQSEIAERVGVSQMHVSRILRRTLDWMRSRLEAE